MNRPVVLILGFLTMAAACDRSHESPPPPSARVPRDVLWISIDTLRSDHLSIYEAEAGPATPAIDGLAAEGTIFTNAWSTYPLTLPAHASVLTGLWPPHHGVRENREFTLPEDVSTVADQLGDSFAFAGFVSTAVLRAETGIGRGFDLWDDPAQGGGFESTQRTGLETVSRALDWLDQNPGPVFQFVHLYEPHTPYDPAEIWRRPGESLYDGEIRTADAAVANLLDGWKKAGRYDDALIVLFADHGEGLGDHGESEHGIFLYRETLHVPLIVRRPGGSDRGRRDHRPASLVDLVPTTKAAIFGGLRSTPELLDGVDLFAESDSEERFLYAESWHGAAQYDWAILRSLVHKELHWISAPREELYNLARDPAERRNLLTERKLPAIFQYELEAIGDGRLEQQTIDEEQRQRLISLGYVGGLSLHDAVGRSDAPDPKDGIAEAEMLWASIREIGKHKDLSAERRVVECMKRLGVRNQLLSRTVANNLMHADRAAAAAEVLAPFDVTGEPETQQLLAEVEVALGQWERAEARFQHILDYDASSSRAYLGMGILALERDRTAEAVDRLERALQLDPELTEAWVALGAALAQSGNMMKAEAAWRSAVELDPEETDAWFNLARAAKARGDTQAEQTAMQRWRALKDR